MVAFLPSAVYAEKWDISQDNTISIKIMDGPHTNPFRENYIWQALETYDTANGRYLGWNYALQSLNSTVPRFELVEEKQDISIYLLNHTGPVGRSGQAVLHTNNSIIQSVIINVYNIEQLSKHELLMVIRHELGHSLGLGHSNDPHDLMNSHIPYYSPYISQENLKEIDSIYNLK